MPTFKNTLDALLADAVLASGIQRQQALDVVRTHMSTTDIDTLRREVSQITSKVELTMLQAAGVPQGLQAQFFTQIQRYMGA